MKKFLYVLPVMTMVFFGVANNVFADDTFVSAKYMDNDGDGTVDRIRILFDEGIGSIGYEPEDWTINNAGDINISITGAFGEGSTALILEVNADAFETGGDVNPVISYNNNDGDNSIMLDSGPLSNKQNMEVTDNAKPFVREITSVTDPTGDRTPDIVLNFSEKIDSLFNATGGCMIPQSNLPAGDNTLTITKDGLGTDMDLGIYNCQITNITDKSSEANVLAGPFDFSTFEIIKSTDDFVFTVKTDNNGDSTDTQFVIPTVGFGYDYFVDCNDDGIDETSISQDSDYTCEYGASGLNTGVGTYTIRIRDHSGVGTGFPRVRFDGMGTDEEKILTIKQWGKNKWTSMEDAFRGCSNLQMNATDVPDLSTATSLKNMFREATNLHNSTGTWNWNTVSVEDMSGMFRDSSFNGDISNWNTSNVTNMNFMFAGASAFNKDISDWNTSKVENMASMFRGADVFDQDLSSWNVEAVTHFDDMFDNDGVTVELSTNNYDALLNSWNAQNIHSTMNFDGGNSKYCAAIAHNNLTSATGHNWTITDGGLDTNCPPEVTPIYRLYNTKTGAQLYTRGQADRDKVLNKWHDFEFTDGEPAFWASLTSQLGLTPIYRLYNTKTGAQLYTRGQADRDKVLNKWHDFEFTDGAPAFYMKVN